MVQSVLLYRQGEHKSMKFGEKRRNGNPERNGKYGRDDINADFGVRKQQLTAKKLVFSFDRKSFLYYLNGKNIEL